MPTETKETGNKNTVIRRGEYILKAFVVTDLIYLKKTTAKSLWKEQQQEARISETIGITRYFCRTGI